MYQKSSLSNGLRVLTAAMPNTHSATVSLYIGTGSRYEVKEEAGISHFVEHLCFKGTRRRPTAREISEAIDGVGGIINGGTDRELTVFYCKVAAIHLPLALDILTDMMCDSLFDPDEVEKERRVVLEELAAMADSPAQQSEDLIDSLLWPDHPLGWDVAGTQESVNAITRRDLVDYRCRQYVPNNAVLSVAGCVSHGEVLEQAEGLLGDWKPGQPSLWRPVENGLASPSLAVWYKKTEQAHICLGMRSLPLNHPDRYALALLCTVLGEGMSSRLFLELRERRGLVYDVYSYTLHLLDTGAFVVYAATQPPKAVEAIQLILQELAALRNGVTHQELTKAKELAKGRLLLRLEDTRNVSSWMGGQEALLGTFRTPEEVVARIEAVTEVDVRRVARTVFDGNALRLAVVGPFRSDKRFAPVLKL